MSDLLVWTIASQARKKQDGETIGGIGTSTEILSQESAT